MDTWQFITWLIGSNLAVAVFTWLTMRRKIKVETTSSEVGTVSKLLEQVEKLQDRNAELYDQTIELEKKVTEGAKVIENIGDRLSEREGQLNSANKQLELLRKLAEDAPIVQTLKEQLHAVNTVVAHLTDAANITTQMLKEKDKALNELSITNRDLSLPKVPKD